jgi:hypothetical protein
LFLDIFHQDVRGVRVEDLPQEVEDNVWH